MGTGTRCGQAKREPATAAKGARATIASTRNELRQATSVRIGEATSAAALEGNSGRALA